jgi:hypothetical protein
MAHTINSKADRDRIRQKAAARKKAKENPKPEGKKTSEKRSHIRN